MRQLLHKYRFGLIGLLLGAFGGLLYWKYIGCTSGQCRIQSDPWLMIPYGALMGYLIADLIKPIFHKKNQP